MEQRDRERLLTALDSPSHRVLCEAVAARVREWSAKLIEDADLPEHERRALVLAIRTLKEGIGVLYTEAGVQMPSWLTKELFFYRDND